MQAKICKLTMVLMILNLTMFSALILAEGNHTAKYSYASEPARILARDTFVVTPSVPDLESFKTKPTSPVRSKAPASKTFVVYFNRGSSIINDEGIAILKAFYSKIGEKAIAVKPVT